MLGQNVAPIFEKFFARHNVTVPVDPLELHETDRIVTELTSVRRLSDALLDLMAPRLGATDVYHYTSVSSFKAIATQDQFRLASLSGRLTQSEYTTFAQVHGLAGVFQQDAGGRPMAETLTQDLYFGSFSDPAGHDEDEMWRAFGQHGAGVRLRLRIRPNPAILRMMDYGSSLTPLTDLNNDLRAAVGKPFVPRGLWTLAAFYLPNCFKHEGEIRLIMPDYPGAGRAMASNGQWPVKLDGSDIICNLTVVSVQVGPEATPEQTATICSAAATRNWPVI